MHLRPNTNNEKGADEANRSATTDGQGSPAALAGPAEAEKSGLISSGVLAGEAADEQGPASVHRFPLLEKWLTMQEDVEVCSEGHIKHISG